MVNPFCVLGCDYYCVDNCFCATSIWNWALCLFFTNAWHSVGVGGVEKFVVVLLLKAIGTRVVFAC